MPLLTVSNRIGRPDVALGLVRLDEIEAGPAPASLLAELSTWAEHRRHGVLTEAEESIRAACRDMLRNGKYRPTGRGKPASEYLLRTAAEENFPRINGPVDANNLVSIKYGVPISLWDLDLAGTQVFEFRLGVQGESYVFNATGQVLELADLICGCAMTPHSEPIVTPVKDGLRTKIKSETRRVAGCIYYPLGTGSVQTLQQITEEFLHWLMVCSHGGQGTWAMALPNAEVTL